MSNETTYIIYVKEKEISQAGALESGNHSIVVVDNDNPASVEMFRHMKFAMTQEAEHVKIEVLQEHEPIKACFTYTQTTENTAYMDVPHEVYAQGGDEAIKQYIQDHQDKMYDHENRLWKGITNIKII